MCLQMQLSSQDKEPATTRYVVSLSIKENELANTATDGHKSERNALLHGDNVPSSLHSNTQA